MTNTLLSPHAAWELANSFDWESDKRFQSLWAMVTDSDYHTRDCLAELALILGTYFESEFDPQDDEEFDIYDVMDDLHHDWS